MAPIKRSLAVAEGEAHSTAPNSSQRKRVRTSNVLGGRDDDSDSDASSPLDSSSFDADDSEAEALLEERATQIIREKFSRQEENVPAENGIIEKVECRNFMCHEHFDVDLGPLINFIVGKNGSGKSAILTALTLCLGGKASSTNRGQSLKNFIKEGQDSATIIVHIKNQGDNAYLPNEYGDSIIVERYFSRHGTSGFKLRSKSGRIVSHKKADLDMITDYYALQIDNPMNILSQDMARQFLSTSSPAEKYKFFVKGVQLEQLDQDYRLMEDSIDQAVAKMDQHREQMKALEAVKDKADRKLKVSERHEGLREKIRNLRGQAAWAQVEEQERIRDSYDDEIALMAQKLTALDGEIEAADQHFEDAERELEAATRTVQEATSEFDGIKDERQEIQERYDSSLAKRHEIQAEQRSVRELIKSAESRFNETQQNIVAQQQRLAESDDGTNARRRAELEEKKVMAGELHQRYESHQKNRTNLLNDRDSAEKKFQSAGGPISKQRGDLQQAEIQLQTLIRNKGQQQNGFPEKMPTLLRAIQQEKSFSRPPVGPLGRHVRLLKPKWSPILETSFGGSLSAFVVTSRADMNILSRIMERVSCVCPIFIGNDTGRLDTSAHEPDSQFDTALRVLEIDNDLVRRQLIINHGIEQMLLIEDLQDASKILFEGERPKNVKRCYCIDKTDRRRGFHLSFSRLGEPVQSPVPTFTRRPRMKTDIETQIGMQRDAVESLKRALHELEKDRGEVRAAFDRCKQAVARHERESRDLQIQVQKAEDHVEALQEAIDKDSVADGELETMKKGLLDAKEDKELHERFYQDSVNAMDTQMEKLRSIKRELAEKDQEIASCEQKIKGLQTEEATHSHRRRKALGEKNIIQDRIEKARNDKVSLEGKREVQAEVVLGYNRQASAVSERVPVPPGETASSVDKKLEKLKEDLDRYHAQMGATREEIATAAAEAKAKYERSRSQYEEFEETMQKLKETLINRRSRWDKFRSYISAKAKVQFTYFLSERSFRGTLLADHQKKLLDIQVEPDITKDNSNGRNAKTLSGGEKSFSQICLLLSLWEAMGSPIRCLDEFDVYMDLVNRSMTIEMLMAGARRSVGRQFILITPGSRDNIQLAPDVRVKELKPPERGQTTLNFPG